MHKTTFEFEDALWLQIESFRKAIGATSTGLARLALEEYITKELEQNPGIRDRYERQRATLLTAAGNNISQIGARRKPRKTSPRGADQVTEKKG